MGQPGYILRFVDIVLILLFGMISVSRIEPSDIQPPESTETPDKPIVQERVLFVGIQTDGVIQVDEGNKTLQTLSELTEYLQENIDQFGRASLKVRVRSSHRAPMQYLMKIAALCDELGLRKSIEVETK